MAYTDQGDDGRDDVVGVGGWLAFFVFALAVISPVMGTISVAMTLYGNPSIRTAYGESFGQLEIFEWALHIVSVAVCWYVVWRLIYVRTRSTVRVTIATLWLFGPIGTFIEVLGISLIAGVPPMTLLGGAAIGSVRPAISATIWTLYFLNSKRVASTYSEHDHIERVAEVFD